MGTLRIATGREQPWPGITLRAPAGHWDLSTNFEVALELRNAGTNSVTVYCRVDNPGADGTEHCVTGSVLLGSGRAGMLRVPLKRTADDKQGGRLFGLRGYPVTDGGAGTIDPKNITQLVVFVAKPSAEHIFELARIRAVGCYVPPRAWTTDANPFFPLIDTFGQYRHKNWPGKTKSLSELAARKEQETLELAAKPGPPGWDQYGGWLGGPQRQGTGFFRTEKVNGKWWLVDPEGRLFFSHGIDCVRMLDTTPIEEREAWFEDFPGTGKEFAAFLSRGHALLGHYAGRSPQCFSFAAANLLRKYGNEWQSACREVIHKRLRSWGLNTIGNWSDEGVWLLRRTPYTDLISGSGSKALEGGEGYWGKFPDVFDPSFTEAIRRSMQTREGKSAGDPWCLGYFSDNELSWGDELSLGLAALKSPPGQKAKEVFILDLKAKYGELAKLNAVWGTQYASWDGLSEKREPPDKEKARADWKCSIQKWPSSTFARYARASRRWPRTSCTSGAGLQWSMRVPAPRPPSTATWSAIIFISGALLIFNSAVGLMCR